MDTLRTAFIAIAIFAWVLTGFFLVGAVFSDGFGVLGTALALGVIGLIFFGLNKLTARK